MPTAKKAAPAKKAAAPAKKAAAPAKKAAPAPKKAAPAAKPAVPRNVLFILTESVRADCGCPHPGERCANMPFSDRAAPERQPLRQMRASSTTTAIELAVLWSGLPPYAGREALHRAPVPVTAPLSPAALAYERLWGELSGRGYTASTQQAVRERASTSVTTGPPPKEQPPRKLSGKRTGRA